MGQHGLNGIATVSVALLTAVATILQFAYSGLSFTKKPWLLFCLGLMGAALTALATVVNCFEAKATADSIEKVNDHIFKLETILAMHESERHPYMLDPHKSGLENVNSRLEAVEEKLKRISGRLVGVSKEG